MKIKYKCKSCGCNNRKLWRQTNTFASHIKLLCALCACQDQGKPNIVDRDGCIDSDMGRTDQIGSLVPAVTTEDGEDLWGYTSVPQDRVEWWRSLPT